MIEMRVFGRDDGVGGVEAMFEGVFGGSLFTGLGARPGRFFRVGLVGSKLSRGNCFHREPRIEPGQWFWRDDVKGTT